MQILADVVPDVRLMGFSYHDLDRYPDPALSIDLLLISIASPERLTSLVTAGLRAFLPQKVVLLGESTPDHAVIRALPASVAGFIDQSAPAEIFVETVRRVLDGDFCFPWEQRPDVSASSATLPVASPSAASTEHSNAPSSSTVNEFELLGLTRRQYEVLVLLSRGHALKSVARILDISLGTTKAHTESVYQRLGAHNRNQAVYLARAKGASLNWEPLTHGGNSKAHVLESGSGSVASSPVRVR